MCEQAGPGWAEPGRAGSRPCICKLQPRHGAEDKYFLRLQRLWIETRNEAVNDGVCQSQSNRTPELKGRGLRGADGGACQQQRTTPESALESMCTQLQEATFWRWDVLAAALSCVGTLRRTALLMACSPVGRASLCLCLRSLSGLPECCEVHPS